MKRISKSSSEYTIAKSLTSPALLSDPRSHCVPILDYFEDDSEEDLAFMVMPLLRRFDRPPFSFVSEVIDFIHQTLEVSFACIIELTTEIISPILISKALVFIHENRVAHR